MVSRVTMAVSAINSSARLLAIANTYTPIEFDANWLSDRAQANQGETSPNESSRMALASSSQTFRPTMLPRFSTSITRITTITPVIVRTAEGMCLFKTTDWELDIEELNIKIRLRGLIFENPDEFMGPDSEEETTFPSDKQCYLRRSPGGGDGTRPRRRTRAANKTLLGLMNKNITTIQNLRVANFEFSSLKESKEVANGESELALPGPSATSCGPLEPLNSSGSLILIFSDARHGILMSVGSSLVDIDHLELRVANPRFSTICTPCYTCGYL